MLTSVKNAQRKFSTIAKRSGGIVNWPTEFEFARQIIARSKLLPKCVPQSITDAIINIAAMGLSLNPQRKHCALIPRWDNQLKAYVCNADPMFQGLIALATQSESILDVRAEIVRETDVRDGHFRYNAGTTPNVTFNPNPFLTPDQRGPIVGAFCIAQVRDAHPHVTFMRIEKILQIRDNYSESWKYKIKAEKEQRDKGIKNPYHYGGPWEDAFDEMCLKTVIKNGAKTWPRRSEALDRALAASDDADGMRITRRDTDIDVESTEVITKSMADSLQSLLDESHVNPEKVMKRFQIRALAELPREEFGRCEGLLKESKLTYVLRHATPETHVYAEDYGISFEKLEGMAADEQSKAKLYNKREPA